MVEISRCVWPKNDPLMLAYHDTEWGVPVTEERKLFEFITLDAFQAGLSWALILRKRAAFREALANFEPQQIAMMDENAIADLMRNEQLIRNRAKLRGTITNARAFLQVQAECGSFAHYLWQWVDYQPIVNHWRHENEIPAATPLAVRLSQDLRRRGFCFVGPTICYAFLQAAGLVNDHLTTCFRHTEIQKDFPPDTIKKMLEVQPVL